METRVTLREDQEVCELCGELPVLFGTACEMCIRELLMAAKILINQHKREFMREFLKIRGWPQDVVAEILER